MVQKNIGKFMIIPLFIAGYKELGKEFIIKNVIVQVLKEKCGQKEEKILQTS